MNGFADQGLNEGDFTNPQGFSVSTFDAFPKTKHNYLQKTRNGSAWTILLFSFCAWLTVTEFWRWMEGHTTHSFSVEKGIAHDLQLNLDVVIAMKCADLRINVQDASGDRVIASERLHTDPTNFAQWGHGSMIVDRKTGERRHKQAFAGSPLIGQQFEQYRDQEDVHKYLGEARARRKWPGTPKLRRGQNEDACRVYGSVEGNKVQGDFHITARGHGYQEMGHHLEHGTFNFSHHITELSFGPYFPAIAQPLSSTHTTTSHHFHKYQYYLSLVPTIYTDAPHSLTSSSPPHIAAANHAEMAKRRRAAAIRGGVGKWNADSKGRESKGDMAASEPDHPSHGFGGGGGWNPFSRGPHTIYTNQYAVTEQSRRIDESQVPGIFWKYDIEPVLLTVSEEWGGVLGLVVRCVNVVAGVLVAGGWVVSLVDWAGDFVGRRRRRSRTMSQGGLLYGGKEKEGLE